MLLCFPEGYDRDKAQDDDQGNAGYLYEKQHPKRTPEILHRYAVRKQLDTGSNPEGLAFKGAGRFLRVPFGSTIIAFGGTRQIAIMAPRT